ncbi:MAG: hypothetical protein ACREDS_14020, partial [Limisphaerales bacterium]
MTELNESRTISVSELGLPDEATVSKFSSNDIRRILAAKVRRGCVIGHILSIICFAVFIFVIFFYHNTPLA